MGVSGGVMPAALPAISPKWAELVPEVRTPFSMVIVSGATPQLSAAASTRTARAAAPAWRYCMKLLAIAVEPPVPCDPKNRFA